MDIKKNVVYGYRDTRVLVTGQRFGGVDYKCLAVDKEHNFSVGQEGCIFMDDFIKSFQEVRSTMSDLRVGQVWRCLGYTKEDKGGLIGTEWKIVRLENDKTLEGDRPHFPVTTEMVRDEVGCFFKVGASGSDYLHTYSEIYELVEDVDEVLCECGVPVRYENVYFRAQDKKCWSCCA